MHVDLRNYKGAILMRSSVILILACILVSYFFAIWLMGQDLATEKIQPWLLDKARENGEIEFIVIMKERPDLSLAYKIKDKVDRVRYVYETLLEAANRSQADLRRWLESKGIEYRWFYTTNALLVKGNLDLIYQIASRDDVKGVYGNPVIHHTFPEPEKIEMTSADLLDELSTIEWNVNKIKAPQVWSMGHRGEGVVVGAQDTGYRWAHKAVKNQYRGWNGNSADHNYNWHDSIHPPASGGSCGTDSPVPCDDNGHGTHTIGTVLGSDFDPNTGQNCTSTTTNQVGVAPCARWIGCRNMAQGDGTPARYIECFDFFLAPYPVGGNPNQGDPSKAPDLTTNSWGCPTSEGCSWNTLQDSVNAHYAAGIMFVAAAGNSGSSCNTVTDAPAMYLNTYTVGSTTSSNTMSSFSSRGPGTGTGLIKPNIVAPGSNVRSSYYSSDTSYTTMSGTSMATPCVAGAVALLWSCYPNIKNDIDTTRSIFNATAVRLTSIVESCGGDYVNGPNNTWGYGLMDVYAACNYCTPPAAPTGLTASPIGSNTIRLTWNAVSGATSYKIYRADNTGCPGNNYIYKNSVSAPTTTYDDTNVSSGITYAYIIRAANICDSSDSSCAQATAGPSGHPGEIIALYVAKNGTNLNFSWTAPGGSCFTTDYALYKGNLSNLSSGYSHNTQITCSTSGNTYYSVSMSNPNIGNADYYIATALNNSNEGSYGRNSNNNERPTSSNACKPQDSSSCN